MMDDVADFEELAKKSWQSFSTMKRFVSEANRLENASWRLWFMQRNRTHHHGHHQHTKPHDEAYHDDETLYADHDGATPTPRVLCVYCEIHSASLSCHGCCHDAYCVSCFKLIHKKGHLATHTAVKIKSLSPRERERLAAVALVHTESTETEYHHHHHHHQYDSQPTSPHSVVHSDDMALSTSPHGPPPPMAMSPPVLSPDHSRHTTKDKSTTIRAKSWEVQMDMLLQRLMVNSLHSDNDISVHNIDSRHSLGTGESLASFLSDTTNSEDMAQQTDGVLDDADGLDHARSERPRNRTSDGSLTSIESTDADAMYSKIHAGMEPVDERSNHKRRLSVDVADQDSTAFARSPSTTVTPSSTTSTMSLAGHTSPSIDPAAAPDGFEDAIPLSLFPTTLTKTKSRKKNSVCANCNGNHITIDCPLLENSIGGGNGGMIQSGTGGFHGSSGGVDTVIRKCFTTIHNDNLSNSTHAFLGDEISVRGGGNFTKALFTGATTRSSSFGMLSISEDQATEEEEDSLPLLGGLQTPDPAIARQWDCTTWMVSSLATELPLDVFEALRESSKRTESGAPAFVTASQLEVTGWINLKRPGRKWCRRYVCLYRNNLWEYLDDKTSSRPIGYANLAEGSVHAHQNTQTEFAFRYFRHSSADSPRDECWIQCETEHDAMRWRDALMTAARLQIDDIFDLRPDSPNSSPTDDGYELGKGRFASVRRARRRQSSSHAVKTNTSTVNGCCALKIIDKTTFWDLVAHETEREDTVIREILTQTMLTVRAGSAAYCPVIRLLSLFETRSHLVMELELMREGDLHEEIVTKSAVSESRASFLVASLVHAIQFCQQNGVAHRDVKLSNLALDTSTCPKGRQFSVIKLADFGMAAFVQADGMLKGRCGTPGFVAPEILTAGKGEAYPSGVDMFSVGVVTYTMLCGYEPFFGVNDEELIQMNKAVDYEFEEPEWSSVSDEAKDLITLMMEKDTTRRITPLEALQHPFLVDAGRTLQETALTTLDDSAKPPSLRLL